MDTTEFAHELYLKNYPYDYNMHKLEHWDQLEKQYPLLFTGMYQFWCYKPKY